ncbi:MAG TPA: glycerophosphodiester phosphodiesterase [Micrococcales bacterium]|uniref:glycerophosphodiester phosphodiesterase family protein n=1 Tax=Miniimonas TaxID=947525 RepID=UPI000D526BBE|nr:MULTISPECIES: glycerophosphodiester phosphodiesterase family protein [Miniimonas]HCX86183.1 glycerophosphodiester phosphodiesterase [Micrococcales bacterium]
MNRRRDLYHPGKPVILAHRGGMAESPENTREAVSAMLAVGVRAMETDVRHSSDGVPVLAHDVTLARRFGDPRDISTVPWRELAALRDVDGAAPLRLDELLAEHPDVVVNIDAKTDEVVGPVLRAVRQARATERVCLTAFSSRRVARMARITGERVMLGAGMADAARLVALARMPERAAASRLVGAGPARAIQVPLTFRGVPVVTPRFVAAAHAAGHVVHVWTVNDPDEMDRLLDLGVDGVVTDVPSLAVEVFARRGLAPWPEVG